MASGVAAGIAGVSQGGAGGVCGPVGAQGAWLDAGFVVVAVGERQGLCYKDRDQARQRCE
jgi:hypothetical protein